MITPTIRRPMKAPTDSITDEQLQDLAYPLLGSPKLDGFRCMVTDHALTASMKPFANRFVQSVLSDPLFAGVDGEVLVGNPTDPDVYHNTSGPLRRFDGEPDFKFYAFDNFKYKTQTYKERWLSWAYPRHPRLVRLEQTYLTSPEEVIAYENEMLSLGYEGAMIRSPLGVYKEGRCTLREGNIFKRKPFVDCEAVITGYEEEVHNANEAVVSELGLKKRSHHQDNLIPSGTLGTFILRSPLWEKTFKAGLGKGFTAEVGQKIWNERDAYLGLTVTVKYQKYGSFDRPRIPSIIKLRPLWDIS